MKLTDLNPHWVGAGGVGIYNADGSPAPRRHGIGLSFDCPCADCAAKRVGNSDDDYQLRQFVAFTNPIDGGAMFEPKHAHWQRAGETFDTLTLTPSIHSMKEKGGCGWHGFITDGVVTP